MKLKKTLITGVIVAISIGAYFYKDKITGYFREQNTQLTNQTTTSPAITNKEDDLKHTNPLDTLTIASWNIQNFGEKKARNKQVMDAICDVIKTYDLIAIQEISNVYELEDANCQRNSDAHNNKNFKCISTSLDRCFSNTPNKFKYVC